MSLTLALLAKAMTPLLAQVGPFVAPGAGPTVPQRPGVEGRDAPRRPARTAAPALPRPPSRLQACLDDAEASPTDAIDDAEQWLTTVKGTTQVEPNWCLGAAHSRRGEWDEAAAAYLAARDAAAPGDYARRARLGGMAGNAALAGKAWARALAALDMAQADAAKSGDARLSGEIAIDRARALVALGRDVEAAKALAEARISAAKNPLAWLLSATLSRRQGKLADAQAQIAAAAILAPTDSEVGLEAGVIAVLAGRDEAARKSWQSVITAAPTSEAATTARSYLAQLGGPASKTP